MLKLRLGGRRALADTRPMNLQQQHLHRGRVCLQGRVGVGALVTAAWTLVFSGVSQADPGSERPGWTDPAARVQAASELHVLAERAKSAAWDTARRQGWQPAGRHGNTQYELMAIVGDKVYVVATTNYNAAVSTAANRIRGIPPYSLTGAGLTIGMWDGGAVRTTHQEFGGRVTILDGGSFADHATHVAGTLGASGVDASAIGMAPAVAIHSYEWTADTAEMAQRAMAAPGEPNTIQISNHSYGYLAGWSWLSSPPKWYGTWGYREAEDFGAYDEITRQWDRVCYEAPYYLPFTAAGNDRSDSAPAQGQTFQYWWGGAWQSKSYNPSTDPYGDGWDNGGFDTIGIVATAKNIVVVGAVNDAVAGGVRSLASATMTSFSCWGPTDDGRVKPDIVANGTGLYSSLATSDSSYASWSGTSMAAPNAAGSAALLLEYYGRLFPGQWMLASTLKALIIHTADDIGTAGPDYQTGWGLMNVRAAADHLAAHAQVPTAHRVVEGRLTAAQPATEYVVTWDGSSPLRATLCWTDPPAAAGGGLDDPTPRLVNDLDLRIIAPDGSTTFLPFVLNPLTPTAPAGTGDNTRDNVEQVLIPAPALQGAYTVRVSHKGTLTDGEQVYSLMISGQGASRAGRVRFDADRYACEAAVHIELSDADLREVGTHTVLVTSTGGDAETVLLTETPVGAATFYGSIPAAEGPANPSDGTLDLTHGASLTVTYEDADDGTGNPAVVQDSALADCRPPVVTGVSVTAITPASARVVFQTDEPAIAAVRYGTSCGALTGSVPGSQRTTSHEMLLLGLLPETVYRFAIEATDEAGNTALDDAGGACYSFTTPAAPDYFTEQFSGDNDLDYQCVVFWPNGSSNYYRACREPITGFPTDPSGGTPLALSDDGFVSITLVGASVRLYDAAYSTVYVGSNGYITFGAGDSSYSESPDAHFRMPRVSALFDDLNPGAGGSVSWKQLGDRVVITYQNVPEWNTTNPNSFQIEMFFDGSIRLSYLGIGASDGLAGLSRGQGVPVDFFESNLSEYRGCPAVADFDYDGDVDLSDFGTFQACYNGPMQTPWRPDCSRADFDGDGDVDVGDFAVFQACFNGPDRAPTPTCPGRL